MAIFMGKRSVFNGNTDFCFSWKEEEKKTGKQLQNLGLRGEYVNKSVYIY